MTCLLTAERDNRKSRAAAAKPLCCTTLVKALMLASLSIFGRRHLRARLSSIQRHSVYKLADCLLPAACNITRQTRHSREHPMITLRPAAERGTDNLGWLDSRHTFSFGHYYDAKHMGFGPLRVINEDRVRPGARVRHARAPGHGDHLLRSRRRSRAQGQHRHRIGDQARRRPGDVGRHRDPAQRVQPLANRAGALFADMGTAGPRGAFTPI